MTDPQPTPAKAPWWSRLLAALRSPASAAPAPAAAYNFVASTPGEAAAVAKRQADVRAWWVDVAKRAPNNLVGIALSGGGIRSATFSLGVVQALARARLLGRVDVMSTVSGGSYIACFLRGLCLPQRFRGVDVDRPPSSMQAGERDIQYDFAMAALQSSPGRKRLAGPNLKEVCNPLWWLREHSRYLAPNGASDYGKAAGFLVRNWLSMLFVFSLAVALLLTLSSGVEMMLHRWGDLIVAHKASHPDDHSVMFLSLAYGLRPRWPWSPALVLAVLPFAVALGLGVAYWLTAQMSVNEPKPSRQRYWLLQMALVVLAFALLLVLVLAHQQIAPMAWRVDPGGMVVLAALVSLAVLALALGLIWFIGVSLFRGPAELLTANLRSSLNDWMAAANYVGLAVIATGMVETTGEWLRAEYWTGRVKVEAPALATVLSAGAFLANKLPQWFGPGAKGGVTALMGRFLPAIALIAGTVLYGLVASAVAALVLAGAWTGPAWETEPDWPTFATLALVAITMGVIVGRSCGFINLSSLHNLYATRLTRAYLGAGNVDRLWTITDDRTADVSINDNHAADYIQPQLYGALPLPAPLHLINVTLNCTIDLHSQIVARDRKGVIATLGPDGVTVGVDRDPDHYGWSRIGTTGTAAQSLILGQWCAISGAAASTGMGRMTSLGYALFMSFANARLGYWWYAPDLKRRALRDLPFVDAVRRVLRLRFWPFRTFVYLGNEMTARYSRAWTRKYLSDGGHFENTGAYTLLRRDVPHILLCDNGQDPDFSFADVENLVRLARLDLERELRILEGDDLAAFAAQVGAGPGVFIDPRRHPDWRARMKAGTQNGLALVMEATEPGGRVTSRLVLIKPHLVDHLPEDVLGYARAHADFPQQSTGEQFFDEAQWESYRRLGQLTMERLLQRAPGLL